MQSGRLLKDERFWLKEEVDRKPVPGPGDPDAEIVRRASRYIVAI